ncbi:MAG TPA: hypothetical protein VFN61_07490 [Acidimicrobiales bacterium]|nr:hypothetical protein [Acidimicrobiales bacterium]
MTTQGLPKARVGARSWAGAPSHLAALLSVVAGAFGVLVAGAPVAGAVTAPSGGRGHAVTEPGGSMGQGKTADPSVSLPPPPAMVRACEPGQRERCDAAALVAIDSARAREHVGPMHLPSGYSQLALPAQVLVVADLERTDRGLPGFTGLSSELDRLAAAGAAQRSDPTGPSGAEWGSNVAIGYVSALQADYAWMYDDGLGSANSDCHKGSTSGCWGHRHNILGNYGLHPAMGAAVLEVPSKPPKVLVFTQLFAGCQPGALDVKLPALG